MGGPVTPAGLPADVARALQVVAAWAIAEHGAQALGDLLTLAPGIADLPPDVARSWDRIGQLRLGPLGGAAPPDGDLAQPARDLLDEVEERRRLILTSRTFASAPAHLRQPRRRWSPGELTTVNRRAHPNAIWHIAGFSSGGPRFPVRSAQ